MLQGCNQASSQVPCRAPAQPPWLHTDRKQHICSPLPQGGCPLGFSNPCQGTCWASGLGSHARYASTREAK